MHTRVYRHKTRRMCIKEVAGKDLLHFIIRSASYMILCMYVRAGCTERDNE